MLTDVKCVGKMRSPSRVSLVRTSGSSATTIGKRRIALNVMASATSMSAAPVPMPEIRITCAGAAQTSKVDRVSQTMLKPKSCASAPKPT